MVPCNGLDRSYREDVAVEKDSLTERYTIRDVTSTLHISRTTLLYYEELGIVHPFRDEETGYRCYSDADLFRLLSCKLLKNIGVPLKDMAERLDNEPFTPQHFSDYARILEGHIAYCEAQKVCLARLMELPELVGRTEVAFIEEHYIDFDAAEVGYSRFASKEGLDSLVEAMPIGALGCVFLGGREDGWRPERRGRTVPVRFAHLISGLSDSMAVIGGCCCVRTVISTSSVRHENSAGNAFESWERSEAFGRIQSYMDEHGLVPVGDVFCPYCLPSEQGFVVPFCQAFEQPGDAGLAKGLRDRLRGLFGRE